MNGMQDKGGIKKRLSENKKKVCFKIKKGKRQHKLRIEYK